MSSRINIQTFELDDAMRLAVYELAELRAYLRALDVPNAPTTPGDAP